MDPQLVRDGLPCVSCKQLTPQNSAEFFDGVLLCKSCHDVAKRIEERCTKELKMMMVMLHEAIRNAACEGKLHLQELPDIREPSKKDVLESIVQLAHRRKEKKDA